MANALEHLKSRTKLEWTAGLNTDFQPKKVYRRTSIIGTIGVHAQLTVARSLPRASLTLWLTSSPLRTKDKLC